MLKSVKTMVEHWQEAKAICQEARDRGGKPEFPTGLSFLDEVTGGLRRGEIWVIAGKTGGGKTSLALGMARAFAENPEHTILFLSLEMKGWELALRMFCSMTGVNYFRLLSGRDELKPEMDAMFRRFISGIDFEIVEFGYTFAEVEAVVKKYYAKKKPDVIFIDFLQLIEWKKFKEERLAIMEYIRKIKEWAKLYDIAFVIISQLRRLPSGADYNREPALIDLKGSGSIETTADKVILIYEKVEGEETKHIINLAKNRQGRTVRREVEFRGDIYTFTDETTPGDALAVAEQFGGEVVT